MNGTLCDMAKYRITYCQDEGETLGMWFYAPLDLRKKYYMCNHCQKLHLVKEGVKNAKV